MLLKGYAHHVVNDGGDGRVTAKAYLVNDDACHSHAMVEHGRRVVAGDAMKPLVGELQGVINHVLRALREVGPDKLSEGGVSL